jgi:hypothetical protein
MSWFDNLIDQAIRSICTTSQFDPITDYIGGTSILQIVIVYKQRDQVIIYKTPPIPARKWLRVTDALRAAGFMVDDDIASITLGAEASEWQVNDLCKLAEQFAGEKGTRVKLSELPAYVNRNKS